MAIRLTLKQRFQLSRFFQGESASPGPLELTQRRVFILPTRRGMGLVLAIVLLLLIAFVYNNNLVYLLVFQVASIFFVAILHTFKALAGLRVQVGYAAPVFQGELARFPLTVHNPYPQFRPSLSVRLNTELGFSLDAHDSKTLFLATPARRRGWQSIGTVTLSTVYPLGIFRAWSPLRFDSQVLVYPKPSEHSVPLPLPSGAGDKSFPWQAASLQGVDDFSGLRVYQNSDSPRQIHWRSYAKGQGLMSKQFSTEQGGRELWLDFQQAPGHHLEERLSQLCRWVIDSENAGLRYGLKLPGRELALGQGAKHQAACLEALALFVSAER